MGCPYQVLLLVLGATWPLLDAAIDPPFALLWATSVDTADQTPAFPCTAPGAVSLTFVPSNASLKIAAAPSSEAGCIVQGLATVFACGSACSGQSLADIVVFNGTQHLRFQVVREARPVRHLGGQVLLSQGPGPSNSFLYDAWTPLACPLALPEAPRPSLSPKADPCGYESRPYPGRTWSFFRSPLHLNTTWVTLTAPVLLGWVAANASSMAQLGWQPPAHYLEPTPRPQGPDYPGITPIAGDDGRPLVALLINGTTLAVVSRRFRSGPLVSWQSTSLDAPCTGSLHATVYAGPFNIQANVTCGSTGQLFLLNSTHQLDFHDRDGYGIGIGESNLLFLGASTSLSTLKSLIVTSALPDKTAPGVLAPISDQIGTLAWDLGELGAYHNQALGARASEGVLNVTDHPFCVDHTGQSDMTARLQAALDFARHNYLTVLLPVGVYKADSPYFWHVCHFLAQYGLCLQVTSQLKALQYPRMAVGGDVCFNSSSNYCWSRFSTFKIQGEVLASDAHAVDFLYNHLPRPGRATLWLPANQSAFQAPGLASALLNVSNVNCNGHLQPNILMSAVVQSLDIIIDSHNPAAMGVRLRGAQGSSMEDIMVRAASDAYAGLSGGSGSGGAHSNLTVVGAQFGLDAILTQPSATLSNVRLYNSTCAGLLHAGVGPLSIAGLYTRMRPGIPGVVSSRASIFKAFPAGCVLRSFVAGQPTNPALAGALSIRDGFFDMEERSNVCTAKAQANSASFAPALTTDSGLYLENVVVHSTFAPALAIYDPHQVPLHNVSLPVGAGQPATLIRQLAINPGNLSYTCGPSIAALLNGTFMDHVVPLQHVEPLGALPTLNSLLDQHGWGDNARYPGPFVGQTVINVLRPPYVAPNDGTADASAAIQAAIDDAAAMYRTPTMPVKQVVTVFVPRGVYRISQSLRIPNGVALVGLARHLTLLVADVSVSGPQYPNASDIQNPDDPQAATPVVLFELGAARGGGNSTSSAIIIGAWSAMTVTVPLNNSRTSHWVIHSPRGAPEMGHLDSSYFSLRQTWQTRIAVCGSWFFNPRCAARFFERPNAPWSQGLAYGPNPEVRHHVFFQEDGARNGGGANVSAGRKLTVLGAVAPFKVYQLNGEHGSYGAYTEFRDSQDVLVVGCKSEQAGAGPVIWVRNVSNFVSYGTGGLAEPPSYLDHYPIGFPQLPPALYRVSGPGHARFANFNPQFWNCSLAWSTLYDDALGQLGEGPVGQVPPGHFPVLYERKA
ncbi:uncharacterized protein MONBRDRAFT_9132 [Monosiga brevicollis MX1]|uniref:Rhamnogalacturonase A/B/Epimerase-like pectate lyase domain-containing protein n=1 Tax=Monosiga brevicollis TaxID=81824 RepID=A9V265_MONBE|nr:uncharacterized protein MONBRDRAFT_9132 [Monosiga brevicollis MX1]EDQ88325.1 predicted protein [Monosiga brevicollis MX1]|eukprot:XP_001746918.1 hypothetical protein [Monosiga brevicollis MX1]